MENFDPPLLTPTTGLIAANIVVYFTVAILGKSFVTINQSLLILLGQANFLVYSGWYWQLFTSLFIHVNIVHLTGNMVFLYLFGVAVERIFNKSEYLLVYFSSGFLGNLFSLMLGLNSVSAGASGAIFGLFGAYVIYTRREGKQSVIGALIYVLFFLMLGLGMNVNILAHLGGSIGGLIAGYLISKRRLNGYVGLQ